MPASAAATPPTTQFAGFDLPEQNWFKMPRIWTDITADISSLAELKVVEYVLKHTWGFQEYGIAKHITTDEFMHGRRRADGTRLDRGTGLTKPSVWAGLKNAVAHGYLLEIVDDSDRARVKKYYALRMRHAPDTGELEADSLPPMPPPPNSPREHPPESVQNEPETGGVKNLNAGTKNLNPGTKNLSSGGKESYHRTEIDTLERQQQKETNNNNSSNPESNAAHDAVVVALSTHGIGRNVARKLAREHEPAYIHTKIEYLEFLEETAPGEVRKPAAWLRRAIEDDFEAPDGFISVEDRQHHQNEQKAREKAILEAQERYSAQQLEAEKAAQAATAQWRKELHRRYGTTSQEEMVWKQALEEARATIGDTYWGLFAHGVLLRLDAERVQLGVPDHFSLQRLSHPNIQKGVQRELKRLTGAVPEFELILVDPPETA